MVAWRRCVRCASAGSLLRPDAPRGGGLSAAGVADLGRIPATRRAVQRGCPSDQSGGPALEALAPGRLERLAGPGDFHPRADQYGRGAGATVAELVLRASARPRARSA